MGLLSSIFGTTPTVTESATERLTRQGREEGKKVQEIKLKLALDKSDMHVCLELGQAIFKFMVTSYTNTLLIQGHKKASESFSEMIFASRNADAMDAKINVLGLDIFKNGSLYENDIEVVLKTAIKDCREDLSGIYNHALNNNKG